MRYFLAFLFLTSFSSFQIVKAEGIQNVPNGFILYKVLAGDTLWKITKGNQKLCDIIGRINKIDEFHLQKGKEILIPINRKAKNFTPVPKHLKRLNRIKKVLFVFLKKQYFGFYRFGRLIFWGPVSSGNNKHSTPTGRFRILWKKEKYHSKKYQAKMPYALCISNRLGIFIHAQALPGRPASHGCVRLLNSDAKHLFYRLSVKDPVIIVK